MTIVGIVCIGFPIIFVIGAMFGRATALRQRADTDITSSLPELTRRSSWLN